MRGLALFAAMLAAYFLPVTLRLLDHPRAAAWLLSEGMLYESFGAVCCLLAAIVAAVGWKTRPRGRAGNDVNGAVRLIFAALLLLMFLEEISWGQRLFKFSTPDWLREINTQDETNLHNLTRFQPTVGINVLQPVWLAATVVYLGILPFFARRLSAGETFRRWFGWPIVRRDIGVCFLGSLAIRLALGSAPPLRGLLIDLEAAEIHEAVVEALLMVFAIDVAAAVHRIQSGNVRRVCGVAVLVACPVVALMIYRGWQMPVDELMKGRSMAFASAAANAVRLGQPENAQRRFDEALRLWPDHSEAHLVMGMAYAETGRTAEALAHLSKVDASGALSADTQAALGAAYLTLGELNTALAHFEKAASLRPDDVQIRQTLIKVRAAAKAASGN